MKQYRKAKTIVSDIFFKLKQNVNTKNNCIHRLLSISLLCLMMNHYVLNIKKNPLNMTCDIIQP